MPDGRLRHSKFVGLREDKQRAMLCVSCKGDSSDAIVDNLQINHLDRRLFEIPRTRAKHCCQPMADLKSMGQINAPNLRNRTIAMAFQ
jgi:hypothetical protein